MKYTCDDCQFHSSRMNCGANIKNLCRDCPMHGEKPHSCKCTETSLIGEACPYFKLVTSDEAKD